MGGPIWPKIRQMAQGNIKVMGAQNNKW